MTSKDMITLLASMTSTAFLASKNRKTACTSHSEWFPWYQKLQQPQRPQQPRQPQWPQFINFLLNFMFLSTLAPKWPTLVSKCGMDCQKSTYFVDFGHSFYWRLWRPWMLLLTKFKGHKSNAQSHKQFSNSSELIKILVYIPLCPEWPCILCFLNFYASLF